MTTEANDNTHDGPEYVSSRELAARTGIASVTWQVMRSRSKGPPYYKIGKRCLYKWAEVQAWLDEHKVEAKKAS